MCGIYAAIQCEAHHEQVLGNREQHNTTLTYVPHRGPEAQVSFLAVMNERLAHMLAHVNALCSLSLRSSVCLCSLTTVEADDACAGVGKAASPVEEHAAKTQLTCRWQPAIYSHL